MKNSFDGKDGLTEINMVPLIDVMLVLVVILLMTVTFIVPDVAPEGLNISLPQAKGAKTVAESPIQIELDAHGKVFFDGRPITVSDLQMALADMPKGRAVLIAADKEVRLQVFVAVMDILRQQGFSRISVRTQR